jgi:putative phage-type endonuclease
MRIAYGKQQSDSWIRSRVGRITGSRIADVCSYLTRKSGTKGPGDSSAKRDGYRLELIAERLTGRAKDHYVSPAMEHGTNYENDARLYYEGVMRQMCEPVGFVLHPKYDFTGASPDSLVGADGVLEIKCPETTTHLEYVLGGQIPEEYLPQVAWELACTGRQWVDFVSFDPRVQVDSLRFFYRRVQRSELAWIIGSGKDETVLTGEAVIDYFEREVCKLNAEIEFFFAERGIDPIAPFSVELVDEETGEVSDLPPYDPSKPFDKQDYAFLDGNRSDLVQAP